ncbi:MAG: hypothetical protein DCC56_09100 [Anaerolineae bacterium]|nr:MAG: hypothetical protein DCC56_09100 [Anaerolineae bacterium]WKZ45251.1 MAG: membrane lipoprotein lipid attachment site-containing protein [Anaerolineales bacterium]
MKKLIIVILALFVLSACATSAAPTRPPVVESVPATATGTTLYISATMHIETKSDSWPADKEAFLSFLQQTTDAGIHWSIGGDIGWLESAEDAQEIVQRSAAMGVQWDIHAHNPDDFGKIAYILNSWGVTPTNVVSGFLIQNFDSLQASYSYQGMSWSPQVIWGGVVCAGHKPGCDDSSISLYRPTSSSQFELHNPNGNIIKLGGGSHQLADAELLAAQIANGQYPYPVIGYTIMVEPETLRIATSSTDDLNAILAFVERMNQYPFVRWATIQGTANAWVSAGEVPFQIGE